MTFPKKIQKLPRTKSMQKTRLEPTQNQKRKSYLDLVRGLSEGKRRIILWSIVIIVGSFLFALWIKNTQGKLKSFPKEESKIPSLKQQLQGLPRIELPEMNEEELKKLEEMIKEKSSDEEK